MTSVAILQIVGSDTCRSQKYILTASICPKTKLYQINDATLLQFKSFPKWQPLRRTWQPLS